MPTQTIDFNDVEAVKFNNQYVEQVYLNNTKIWEGRFPYLCFASLSPFSLSVVDNVKYWDGTIEYSTDNCETWSVWDGTSAISSNTNGMGFYSTLFLRGSNNTVITGTNSTGKKRWVFTSTSRDPIYNKVIIGGNIETLLDYSTAIQGGHPVMADNCFTSLFREETKISILAKGDFTYNTLTKVGEFKMPATTLSTRCYSNMFFGCTSLTSAPALPATTLAEYCYSQMFNGCTSLTTAPTLSATTLAANCYFNMFNRCTSLTSAPALPATTLAEYCYNQMFKGCTSLTSIPALPATTLTANCYAGMFYGCVNIKISSTQTGDYVNAYRIPTSGTGSGSGVSNMFTNTGGTFTGAPTINITYYTSNAIVS